MPSRTYNHAEIIDAGTGENPGQIYMPISRRRNWAGWVDALDTFLVECNTANGFPGVNSFQLGRPSLRAALWVMHNYPAVAAIRVGNYDRNTDNPNPVMTPVLQLGRALDGRVAGYFLYGPMFGRKWWGEALVPIPREGISAAPSTRGLITVPTPMLIPAVPRTGPGASAALQMLISRPPISQDWQHGDPDMPLRAWTRDTDFSTVMRPGFAYMRNPTAPWERENNGPAIFTTINERVATADGWRIGDSNPWAIDEASRLNTPDEMRIRPVPDGMAHPDDFPYSGPTELNTPELTANVGLMGAAGFVFRCPPGGGEWVVIRPPDTVIGKGTAPSEAEAAEAAMFELERQGLI